MSTDRMLYRHLDAHAAIDGLALLSPYWLRTLCAFTALSWLVYRAWHVLSKPVEELVSVLGVDLPSPPDVSLAGLKSDGVLLHWKPPDHKTTVVRYQIWVNGIQSTSSDRALSCVATDLRTVRDVSPQESPVTVTALRPDHTYTLRIVAVNPANFQAASAPIRVRTRLASDDCYDADAHGGPTPSPPDDGLDPTPIVRPYKAYLDGGSPFAPPAMAREHSNSQSHGRRGPGVRRSSPASPGSDLSTPTAHPPGTAHTVHALTEKLEALRHDTDDVERQIEEADDETHAMKAALAAERDRLRHGLKEREDVSRDLRKTVSAAERASTAAQARKTAREKQLQQTRTERAKLRGDTARWEQDIATMASQLDAMAQEKARHRDAADAAAARLRERHAEEQRTNRLLEEDIHAKGLQIKTLEAQRRTLTDGARPAHEPRSAEPEAAEHRWAERLTGLQARYHQLAADLTQAQALRQHAQAQLDHLATRRASQSHILGAASSPDAVPGRRGSLRRPPSTLHDPSHAAPGGFAPASGPPFGPAATGFSPSAPAVPPFFNINNGMTLPATHPSTPLAPSDLETLTGGAPMSPTAGASLLPSGLFGDEPDPHARTGAPPPGAGPALHHRPLTHILPGLGAPQSMEPPAPGGPSSPASAQSRSPSLFPSPRTSSSHLAFVAGPDHALDSDRRSVRSTTSSLRAASGPAAPSKFTSLFGLHRQRGKTLSEDGPTLGSLTASQSHSLPRHDQLAPDALGGPRRRGSHSGSWMDSMSSAFTRTAASGKAAAAGPADDRAPVPARRRPFTLFGTKGEDWLPSLGPPRSSSPRPGSVASVDSGLLPRPSTESQQRFGWPVECTGSISPAGPPRSSPLGPDWGGLATTASWSRRPSRRPSAPPLAHDARALDADSDEPDDDTGSRSPTQAPIGTRPPASAGPGTTGLAAARLNPAAPHFKSLFSKGGRDRSGRHAARGSKLKGKASAPSTPIAEDERSHDGEAASTRDAASPSDRRPSRDGRSVSTAADSLLSEPRSSLERSSSRTPSETRLHPPALAPPAGKESFMQRLSRKSSSSKFTLPFGKDKGAGLAGATGKKGAASDVGTVSEVSSAGDNDALSLSVSADRGAPPASGKSAALSWTAIKRIGRKGDTTPSLHESLASESVGSADDDDSTLATTDD